MTQPRTLLVVDDDAAMRQMLLSLFRGQGYDVHEAASAGAALELAGQTELDAVLSDIRMPGRTGVELVGDLRRTPVVRRSRVSGPSCLPEETL